MDLITLNTNNRPAKVTGWLTLSTMAEHSLFNTNRNTILITSNWSYWKTLSSSIIKILDIVNSWRLDILYPIPDKIDVIHFQEIKVTHLESLILTLFAARGSLCFVRLGLRNKGINHIWWRARAPLEVGLDLNCPITKRIDLTLTIIVKM